MSTVTEIKEDIRKITPEIMELMNIIHESKSSINRLMFKLGEDHNLDHYELIHMLKAVFGDKHAVVELHHNWLS